MAEVVAPRRPPGRSRRLASLTALPATAAVAILRAYQRALSPWLGRNCRYLPSCSEYAAMAIEDWGLLRGCWLAARRIVRCHPWGGTGLDLPPRPSAASASRSGSGE